MKKRILSLALVVVMVALVAAGSMAYFTDETEVFTNTMTIGDVEITQLELKRSGNSVVDFTDPLVMVPTTTTDLNANSDEELEHENINGVRTAFMNATNAVDKIVQVYNSGTADAYVATLIAFEDTNDVSSNIKFICGGWTWKAMEDEYGKLIQIKAADGTVYTVAMSAVEKVAAKAYATPALSQVIMKSTATETSMADAGVSYDILCKSFAVQADGFTDGHTAVETAFGVRYIGDANAYRYQATGKWIAEMFPGYTVGYYEDGEFVAYE